LLDGEKGEALASNTIPGPGKPKWQLTSAQNVRQVVKLDVGIYLRTPNFRYINRLSI
jgi:hypothetical protein